VRQCFALPLWFLLFRLLFFSLPHQLLKKQKAQEKQAKQKRQSKALPHSKKAKVELSPMPSSLCVCGPFS
jgi:hypothetical protein